MTLSSGLLVRTQCCPLQARQVRRSAARAIRADLIAGLLSLIRQPVLRPKYTSFSNSSVVVPSAWDDTSRPQERGPACAAKQTNKIESLRSPAQAPCR